jgi:predicted extracellular nuclease
MTMNTENLDAGDTTKIDKLTSIIVDAGCPTFVAMQEVDTASTVTGGEDEVLTDLLGELATAGCVYSAANSHPDIGDHGVAVLWQPDAVSDASVSTEYQGCSAAGSSSSTAYDSYCDGQPGQYPLFSRRPVVLTASLAATCSGSSPVEVVIIANHFKSKLGGAEADQRRLEQGQFVATLANDLITAGHTRVIVAGDLNDFEDSPPVLALTGGGLLSTWDAMPVGERFSYNYEGVSQALDHVLYAPALAGGRMLGAAALGFNADYPYNPFTGDPAVPWRASDHDPVVASFLACVDDPLFGDGFESGDTSGWSQTFP